MLDCFCMTDNFIETNYHTHVYNISILVCLFVFLVDLFISTTVVGACTFTIAELVISITTKLSGGDMRHETRDLMGTISRDDL